MRRLLLAALLLLVAAPALAAELRIASCNVKHLGWDNDKYLPALARVAGRFDLNAPSRQQLQELPHIGPEWARAIEEGRPWEGVGELDRIHGIGPAREADIRESGRACE